MKGMAFGVAVFLMASACGEDDGTCSPRAGLYRMNLTERSGNCGPIPESVINLSDPSDQSLCMARIMNTDPMACRLETDTTCGIADNPNGRITFRGVVTWKPDGSKATGLFSISIRGDGASDCDGSYDVAYTRL